MGRHLMVYCVRLFGALTMLANSLTVKRRWFPRMRFSLRTLLLLVLMIASGGTLWWNWGPWGVAFTIQVAGEIQRVFYTDDDRYIIVHTDVQDIFYAPGDVKWPGGERHTVMEIRDSGSGKLQRILRDDEGSRNLTSQIGSVILLGRSATVTGSCPVVFDIDSGERLKLETNFPDGEPQFALLFKRYALFQFKTRVVITNLPDLETVFYLESGSRYAGVSPSKNSFAVHRGMSIDFYSIEPRQRLHTFELNGAVPFNVYYPKDTLFICTVDEGNGKYTSHFFNPVTGDKLRTESGYIHAISHDSKRFVLEREGKSFFCEMNSNIEWGPLDHDLAFSVFSENDDLLFGNRDDKPCRMFNGRSGELLWERPAFYGDLFPNCDYIFVKGLESAADSILNARTGQLLFTFPTWRWGNVSRDETDVNLAHCSAGFLTIHSYTEDNNNRREAVIWKLKRPTAWYGVAWLPEFWLTVVFGAGLVWSLWRDR